MVRIAGLSPPGPRRSGFPNQDHGAHRDRARHLRKSLQRRPRNLPNGRQASFRGRRLQILLAEDPDVDAGALAPFGRMVRRDEGAALMHDDRRQHERVLSRLGKIHERPPPIGIEAKRAAREHQVVAPLRRRRRYFVEPHGRVQDIAVIAIGRRVEDMPVERDAGRGRLGGEIILPHAAAPIEHGDPGPALGDARDDLAEQGILFTAIGVVTSDPASVESVLSWAARLQNRVEYVIVENATSPQADFTYWLDSDQCTRFREAFRPVVLSMEYRLADLENASRQHGATLAQIALRKTKATELQKASFIIRAQSYRRRLFQEFEKAKEFFLP